MIRKTAHFALTAGVLAVWSLGAVTAKGQTAPWQTPPTNQASGGAAGLNWQPVEKPVSATQSAGENSQGTPPPPVVIARRPPNVAAAAMEEPIPPSASAGGGPAPIGPARTPAPMTYAGAYNSDGPNGPQGDEDDESLRGPIFGLPPGFLPSAIHDHLWFRTEALVWWTKGAELPPLLTTSSGTTAQSQAGVLPGATVLFGNQEVNDGVRGGGRVTLGYWLDPADTFGIDFTYLGLCPSNDSYTTTSTGSPILARPVFLVSTGTNSGPTSQIIAYPDGQSGGFSAKTSSNFDVAELLLRRVLARGEGFRFELLAGYRYQRLSDGLSISDTSTINTVNTLAVFDQFHTANRFSGAEVGFATELHKCRWSLETDLKLGLGDTRSVVNIVGSSTNDPVGGLLAQPSNSGSWVSSQFSAVPELGLTAGYDLTPHLRATLGYTMIYWSDVARPGDQIDLNVSPPTTAGGSQPLQKPAFELHTSDFWAQGVNVGLDFRF
jgi:hypothetical protein